MHRTKISIQISALPAGVRTSDLGILAVSNVATRPPRITKETIRCRYSQDNLKCKIGVANDQG